MVIDRSLGRQHQRVFQLLFTEKVQSVEKPQGESYDEYVKY